MKPLSRLFVTTVGAIALISCSTLPEYATPKKWAIDPARAKLPDVIAYRVLERSDFKADQPPPAFAEYADKLGAATCAYIITTPETQVMVQPLTSADGQTIYQASPDRLGFLAQMDRNCSWWNPEGVGLPDDYLLEHEQIHFALFELEARLLNRAAPDIGEQLRVTAESTQAVIEIVQKELQRQLDERMELVLARSREFDEDTSMAHKPNQQKRWWKVVQSELGAAD